MIFYKIIIIKMEILSDNWVDNDKISFTEMGQTIFWSILSSGVIAILFWWFSSDTNV